MLKADLHIHCNGDPQDLKIRYTSMDVIKLAAKQNFDILSFTLHNKIFNTSSLNSYAKKLGITLISGIEATLSGKHILLYNISNEEMKKINSLENLYKYKDNIVIGAPHPFFLIPSCLGNKVFEHRKLFDFIEHTHFYTKTLNLNKKAVDVAKEFKIPLVANSDVHFLPLFGKDYTLIDTIQKTDAVLDALKKKVIGRNKNLFQSCTSPYTFNTFITKALMYVPGGLYRLIKGDMEFQKD